MLLLLLLPGCSIFRTAGRDNSSATDRSSTIVAQASATTQATTAAPAVPSEFKVYFIDVGQGDAALVICDGHAMLIDGGKSTQSDMIYSFLELRSVTHLDYIVATHPDEDHVGGLAGALNYATVGTAFSSVTEDDSDAFRNFVKYLDKQGVGITVPTAGEKYALGSAEVTVLGPVERSAEGNNNSIVLKVTHGSNSFLFTGDAESEEEESILRSGADVRSTVLKIGHHGSSDATSSAWLDAVRPLYAIISCGEGNEYGHPTKAVLNRLQQRGVKVYRTDLQGYMKVTEENGALTCRVDKNPDANTFVPGQIPLVDTSPQSDTTTNITSRTAAGAATGNAAGAAAGNAAAGAAAGNAAKNTTKAATKSATKTTTKTTTKADDEAEPQVVRSGGGSSAGEGQEYIANKNTKKFHYPYCKSVKQMKEKNKEYRTCTRDELIREGYVPCKNCNP